MTNKEKLKKVIDQDINSHNNYEEIIKKIERKDKSSRVNTWKWSLVPICLVIILSGTLFLNISNNDKHFEENNNHFEEENAVFPESDEFQPKLNINDISEYDETFPKKGETPKFDADIKTVTGNGVNFPLPYKRGLASIPDDLDKTYKYILYLRENKDSKEYNILGNYEIIYSNDNDRSINVKYSKNNKPLRDYYFSEKGSQVTLINDIELRIYKYSSTYFTEFTFNGYYFDIEFSNITEKELLDFLVSITR